jgi:hypothetical protein
VYLGEPDVSTVETDAVAKANAGASGNHLTDPLGVTHATEDRRHQPAHQDLVQ